MTFFRNPEIKKTLLLYFILTVFFTLASFFLGFYLEPEEGNGSVPLSSARIFSPLSAGSFLALFCFCLCMAFTGLYLLSTYKRYRKIRNLSLDIDQVLHGTDALNFSDYREGELSILKIEIDKMLVRLREQAEDLKADSQYLAASLADISHQIRTPLTSIHLILSLLSESGLSQEEHRSLVRQLSILISRIDWLIEALLKLSRLDAGTVTLNQEYVFIQELVAAAVTPLEISMELREQRFSFSAENGKEAFRGDFAWTAEAVGNLLKNCMEHTPPGGEIRAFTSENTIFTELIIEDNGPGFAKEDLPRLFERFYKGKNSGEESIGIGLSLSRTILSLQDATIKAENRPQGGARFILHFYK